MIKIISVRENLSYINLAVDYTAKSWPEVAKEIYYDCISHLAIAKAPLPQWYLLEREGDIIGCAGLITNDFVSRMDLYPWLCALYISPEFRGRGYSRYLINKAKEDTVAIGFENLYLCTALVGFYEKYNFSYVAQGYHPWGESSQIYCCKLIK